MEAALAELLDSEQIERLVEQAAQNNHLSASQQNFLRSVGNMPGGHGDSQPLTPQSADFSRNEDVTPQQEQHRMPRIMPPAFPFMMPPHPFMIQPRMYYPFMAPMPVPPPMGYPMVPPPMLPHQMGPPPPPLSPSPEGRMGGQQEQQGEANLPYSTPDNAHHNLPVQDQLQQDDAEVDGGPPQQLPPPTQPLQSSEMVASSVYPIPPSTVVQANAPPPGPDVVGADAPDRSTHLQKEPDNVVQQSSEEPALTVPGNGGKDQASRPTAEEANSTSTKVVSSLQKHSTTQAATSHFKSQKRKSSQPTSSPATGDANCPGLPCRPSSNVQGSGSRSWKHSYPGGRGKGQGGGGDGQRRTAAKSKTGGTRGTGNSNNKKVEPDKKPLNSTEGGKGEAAKSFHSSRTGEKRQIQDHTGSHAVSGPSHSSAKSSQDPTRNFSPRSRSRSSSSNSSALLETKAFKWGIPSPSANPDVILDSGPAEESTTCQPEPEKSEWPDLSELGISSSNKQKQTFSASLKFSDPAPMQYLGEQFAGVGPAETDSIEDPFPTPGLGVYTAWHSDLGDFPLTLSPSQSICLAQCTGDLNKLDQAANLHKH